MTCGHRGSAVTDELPGLPGTSSAKAVATTGQVTVTSATPPAEEAVRADAAPPAEETVRAATDKAGYELTGTTRGRDIAPAGAARCGARSAGAATEATPRHPWSRKAYDCGQFTDVDVRLPLESSRGLT